MKYAYIHHEGCGKEAFHLTVMPKLGEVMDPKTAFHLNGEMMRLGEKVVCDSCGSPINNPSIRYIVEIEE
jgi:hypothetical protein